MSTNIIHGDCLEELKKLEDNSVDAVVTDPPYGLSNTKPAQVADVLKAWVTGDTEAAPTTKGGFMNASWDSFVPPPAVWEECMRVLKPGGHMAVFAGARTQDLIGLSIRLAGFEIRESVAWIHSSGFARGQDLGKELGEEWEGWSYALKPSHEPIIIARKPLVGGVRENVKQFSVGAINIASARVANGRYPANVVLDSCAAEAVDKQGGYGISRRADRGKVSGILIMDGCASVEELRHLAALGAKTPSGCDARKTLQRWESQESKIRGVDDEGGASRFFPVFKYQAKAPKRERPVIEREDGTKIQHATVKPLALMSWLVELITPPGGTVLDPFAGSGTTLQAALNKGFQPIGIEQDADYIKLIEKRLEGLCTTRKN